MKGGTREERELDGGKWARRTSSICAAHEGGRDMGSSRCWGDADAEDEEGSSCTRRGGERKGGRGRTHELRGLRVCCDERRATAHGGHSSYFLISVSVFAISPSH